MSVWNDCPICGLEMIIRPGNYEVLQCKLEHYVIVFVNAFDLDVKIRNDFIKGEKFCVARWASYNSHANPATYIYLNYPNGSDILLNKILSIEECLDTNKLEMLFLLA